MYRRWLAIACCSGLLACGDLPPSPVVDVDPADRFFDRGRIHEVRIDMPRASWDALRLQSRRRFELLEGDCLAEPFTNPFPYFEARIEIDGESRGPVGVRKKGFIGSIDSVRPGLKVRFDEYTPGGNLYGLDHLTLNNSRQDASYVRQCVSFQAFADAGLPSPRCSFAHVVVNGQDLGVYVNVETIDKDFLARHFDDEDGPLFKATFGDFRAGWTGTFDPQTEGAEEPRIVQELTDVLRTAGDTDLRERVDKLIDLERFLTYWAVEVLLAHWDGYAYNQNNYYLYVDPRSGRGIFLPWGTDQAFRTTGLVGPSAVYARGLLTRRLYMAPQTRTLYLDRLKEVMAVAWDEPKILAEINRQEALIRPVVQRAGGSVTSLQGAVETARSFVRARRGVIERELAPGPPPAPDLRPPPCHTTLGPVTARASTTFGTHGADPFRSGSGSISGTLNELPLAATAVGATIGPDPTAPTARVILTQSAAASPFGTLTFACTFETFRLVPNAVVPLDFNSTAQCVVSSTGGTRTVGAARMVNGAITVEQGSTASGAAVVARIEGHVIQ